MTERIERTERLLNLVICLMASSTPVPRSTIERNVNGYGDSASPAAFERMFERDKEELRSMGIPVETIVDASGEVMGYRIPQDRYALDGIEFTVAERAAVAVAAQVWGQAAMAPVAGTALLKLETVDAEASSWSPADLQGTIQLTARDAALLPLMGALRQERQVVFPYRTPADPELRRRTVSPWGLRSVAGHWFLVGHDHDRGARRTFRLSRIAGPVTITGQPRTAPPADFDIADGETFANAADDAPVRSTVRIAPRRGAALRRRAVSDAEDPWTSDVVVVETSSLDEAVTLVCAAGPDAEALAPPELVAAVAEAHDAVLAAHAWADA
jgi:proteasome accessory factor B